MTKVQNEAEKLNNKEKDGNVLLIEDCKKKRNAECGNGSNWDVESDERYSIKRGTGDAVSDNE